MCTKASRTRSRSRRRSRSRCGAFVVNRGVSFPLDVWNRIKYRTQRVDRVVTVCEQIKDVIVASGELPPEKVVVVYAGTDVALFDPRQWDARAFRREKGIADDRFLIAQVGVRDVERVEGVDRRRRRRSSRRIRTRTSR